MRTRGARERPSAGRTQVSARTHEVRDRSEAEPSPLGAREPANPRARGHRSA
ncbi:hypothetical protein DB31_1935 [Hyalangium minutum]|uniref:Uncharacterized protein n=1 Tax=Hyalangium minutum TaxID=394096 RepID=A0A085WB54_9BACT|nr:hypothetical protein DB31_1935 [Hyalangium minutum]